MEGCSGHRAPWIISQNQSSGQIPPPADSYEPDIPVATKSDLMVMKLAHSATSFHWEKRSSGLWTGSQTKYEIPHTSLFDFVTYSKEKLQWNIKQLLHLTGKILKAVIFQGRPHTYLGFTGHKSLTTTDNTSPATEFGITKTMCFLNFSAENKFIFLEALLYSVESSGLRFYLRGMCHWRPNNTWSEMVPTPAAIHLEPWLSYL